VIKVPVGTAPPEICAPTCKLAIGDPVTVIVVPAIVAAKVPLAPQFCALTVIVAASVSGHGACVCAPDQAQFWAINCSGRIPDVCPRHEPTKDSSSAVASSPR